MTITEKQGHKRNDQRNDSDFHIDFINPGYIRQEFLVSIRLFLRNQHYSPCAFSWYLPNSS
jgi:hypothetical protein